MKNAFKKMLFYLLIIGIMFSSLAATSLAATKNAYSGIQLSAKFDEIYEKLDKNLSRIDSDDNVAKMGKEVLLSLTEEITMMAEFLGVVEEIMGFHGFSPSKPNVEYTSDMIDISAKLDKSLSMYESTTPYFESVAAFDSKNGNYDNVYAEHGSDNISYLTIYQTEKGGCVSLIRTENDGEVSSAVRMFYSGERVIISAQPSLKDFSKIIPKTRPKSWDDFKFAEGSIVEYNKGVLSFRVYGGESISFK